MSLLLFPLSLFVDFFKLRREFELKNKSALESRSFKIENQKAVICFGVSSEGELEQVRPLIEKFLSERLRVEIIYSSPSVEDKIVKFAKENLLFLRVFRMPIVSYFWLDFFQFQNVNSFITAKKFAFCRYDFFPELLLRKMNSRLILLSAAYSKKITLYKKLSYHFFKIIIATNSYEELLFKKHYNRASISFLDFRIMRIFDRLFLSEESLKNQKALMGYYQFLLLRNKRENIIIGSAWPSDLEVLRDVKIKNLILEGKIHLTIAPHSLKDVEVEKLLNILSSLELPVFKIDKNNQSLAKADFNKTVVIVTVPGILCELYTLYGTALVGGGFYKSVHSLLEPFLAGARVLSGPKVHRSTEFDFIASVAPSEIDVILNPINSYDTLLKMIDFKTDIFDRNALKEQCNQKFKLAYEEILKC